MYVRSLLASILVLLAFAVSGAAAQSPLSGSTQLAGQVELARLVDLASDRLQYTIEYDPTVLKGVVTLRSPKGVPDEELWSTVNRMLASRGFTTVQAPGDDSFSVVRLEQAAAIARVEMGDTLGEAGFQTLLLRPQHISTRECAEALRGVLSKPGGSATEIGGKEGTGAGVLVSDLRPRLEQVKALLDRVDVAAQQPAIMTYRVQHLGAESLATLAKQVVTKQEAAGGGKWRGELMASPAEDAVLVISTTPEPWLGLLQQLDQREEVVTRTYVVERFESTEVAELIKDAVSSSDDRWRLVNEELTGSLIITATPSDHAEVVKAMARLDAIEHVATPMKAFVIRHRPVADVLATLSSLVEQGVLEAPQQDDEARVAQSAEPRILREDGAKTSERSRVAEKAEGTSDSLSRMETAQLKMTADEATNTLLVSGNARQIDRLGELIGMIDVRQTQVMLDVMLVSMTDSDSTSLGVELERLGAIDNAATRLASLFGLSTSGAGGRTVGDGPGFTGAVLNPGEFSLVVRALQTLNKGNSLSNPKVLVTNNEQAVFSSTLQQPVQTQTRTGSNDTTFSYGGSESAGTTISVKPRIAQGDQLLLTYSIRLSSFVGTATTAGLPPPKQENSVDSIASIPDGHTVVVGGLEVRGESDGENRVPGLGAIPLLGNLFKNRSTAENRTRFYVFIRPNILRSQGFEDLRFLSERDAGMMGVEDGFPDVQPQVIR